MVAPSVALRFRDTTLGIDTIEQHREVIKGHGSVWWGWWKKDFEENHSELFANPGAGLDIFIVDRSTMRMFLAHSPERLIGQDGSPDPTLIPSYYHHSVKEVHGWFRLTSLKQVEYKSEIANKFGDNTAIILKEAREPLVAHGGGISRKNQSSILVLSDLHFGPDYDYLKQGTAPDLGSDKETLTHCLIKDLKRIKLSDDIGCVMVTGDFTSNGRWEDQDIKEVSRELKQLTKELSIDVNSLICIPGNHDVVRYPKDWDGDISKLAVDNQVSFKHERDFRYFLHELQGRDIKHPLDYVQRVQLEKADVLVGALNSCRILATSWTEYGFVGPSGIKVINQLGEEPVVRPTYKVIAVHHHLLPVNQVEAPKINGVTLSLDASKILEAAQNSNVHVAVHGHQHMPHLARYQSLLMTGSEQASGLTVVSNGSAGVSAKRRPGEERNTYCIFTFSNDGIRLQMREIRSDGKPGTQLYDGIIESTPAVPE